MSRNPLLPRSTPFPPSSPETDSAGLETRLAQTKVPHPEDENRYIDGTARQGNTLALQHGTHSLRARKLRKAVLLAKWRAYFKADTDGKAPLADAQLECCARELADAESIAERTQDYIDQSAESIISVRVSKALAHRFTAADKTARWLGLAADLQGGLTQAQRGIPPFKVVFGGRYRPDGTVDPGQFHLETDDDPERLIQRLDDPSGQQRGVTLHEADSRAQMRAALDPRYPEDERPVPARPLQDPVPVDEPVTPRWQPVQPESAPDTKRPAALAFERIERVL